MYLRNFFSWLVPKIDSGLFHLNPRPHLPHPVGPHHFRQVAYSLVWYCYLHVLQFVLPDRQCNRRFP
eukprot:UN00980